MNMSNFKGSYQEIEPIPQRGLQRTIQNLIIGLIVLCIGIIFLYIVFKSVLHSSIHNESDSFHNSSNSLKLGKSGGDESSLEDVIVKLDNGDSVLGKRMKSRAKREYFAFLGLPYAKVPERFQPPVPAEPWNGILNATEFKPACIQRERRLETNLLPVLVLIHGGGQYGNATKYGAEYLMDADCIYVNFHYRLGVLGNLNLGTAEARGNQGLKDQRIALFWIQTNIRRFGGDNQKVMLFGNSYGGQQTSTHLLSPMSKGLLQRAICESGTELLPFIFTRNPLKSAKDLGVKLKCVGDSPEDLLACFRNTTAESLILSSFQMEFHASVEPDIPGKSDDVFLSDTPLNLLLSGKMNQLPVIFGGTSGEALPFSLPILTSPNLTKEFNENWEVMAIEPLMMNNSESLSDPGRIANLARDFYLGGKELSRDVEANFTAMITDRRILHPATVFANFQFLRNKGTRNNVYLYYFNHPPDKSSTDGVVKNYGSEEYLGAGHGDELHYLFPYTGYDWLELGTKHGNFSQMLIQLWVSFANTGEADKSVDWKPITEQKPYEWFEISSTPKMINSLGKRMEFWDSFNLTDLYI